MPPPNEKLADSLSLLASLQGQGYRVVRGAQLTRTHRERLVRAGFLDEVLKGWYLPARPGEQVAGGTAAWFAGMRDFVAGYCDDRFGSAWHLSPEQSLLLRSGERSLPRQLQIWSSDGNNQRVSLPHECSLFLYRAPKLWPSQAESAEQGLRVVGLAAALVAVGPGFFSQQPMAARIALGMVDETELLQLLLDGSHSVIAGRLAGALRVLGRDEGATAIVETMRSADYTVQEASPFDVPVSPLPGGRAESPYVQRLRLTWAQMRDAVVRAFPEPGAAPTHAAQTLDDVEARYVADAYHSLSIEGYRATPELIERVRAGDWNPDGTDREPRDAMAAKGYFEAHKLVKAFIGQSIDAQGGVSGLRDALGAWYRALFSPSVVAGLLKPSDLAGWRNDQVYIRGAMHVPLAKEAVRDCMPVLFDLIEREPHPAARAVLGHFLFVYIHPYMDGNGRLARFLMNAMLVTGGYVWTVIPVEQRDAYMRALERASSFQDIVPLAEFVAGLTRGQTGAPLARPGG
ncbi:MAG: Fic family protein [Burkholderiaceae bacterium]|nr:Fic family protein [Burkholderiaceae bacterium]